MIKKRIKRLIDKVDVVSFDIFDTLILRYSDYPSDVFNLIEENYNKINEYQINNFKEIRINAEKSARNKKETEITIDDIYNEIEAIIENKNINVNELKKLEIIIEKNICHINNKIKDIINYVTEKNKRIIIASDMYMDKNDIEEILNIVNIQYEKLYLSSEVGFRKSEGDLFDYLIKDLKIEPNKILHIGDNIKSDFFMPKKYGIISYWLNDKKCKKQTKDSKKSILTNIIELNINETNNRNELFNFGYRNLGPFILGFCEMIKNESLKNKVDNIIFLAREGKLIKECFENINGKNFKTSYMYISRKAISSAIIHNSENITDILEMQSVALNETVEMFLKRFNLLNEKNIKLLNSLNLKLNSKYRKNENKKIILSNFEKFILNSEVKEDTFYNYLNSFNITNNSIIVDIGWNGTMQDLIQLELNKKNIIIHGYYIGVREKRKNQYKHGFVFNGEKNSNEILSRGMVAFLEILFSANHGTTLYYDSNSKPVLGELDIDANSLNKIIEIQKGAKAFIKDSLNIKIFEYLNLEKKDWYYNLCNVGINPTLKDIKLFNDIYVFNEKSKKLIGGKFILKYLIKPKDLKRDFLDSGWKIAFFKNIFKIKLPYAEIYKLIYKKTR